MSSFRNLLSSFVVLESLIYFGLAFQYDEFQKGTLLTKFEWATTATHTIHNTVMYNRFERAIDSAPQLDDAVNKFCMHTVQTFLNIFALRSARRQSSSICIPSSWPGKMKIGESLARQKPEIRLPVEIWIQVVSYLPPGLAGQSSVCLVSRQLYSAAISKLYEKPRLNGLNFDEFATVICPPVDARVRRVETLRYEWRI